jgi:hypothetical protein
VTPVDAATAAYYRRLEHYAQLDPRDVSPLILQEVEEYRQSVSRPAAEEYLSAIRENEDLLDRAAELKIPGTTRAIPSIHEFLPSQIRLARARRRCARELAKPDADALVAVLEATPGINPIHAAVAHQIANNAVLTHP